MRIMMMVIELINEKEFQEKQKSAILPSCSATETESKIIILLMNHSLELSKHHYQNQLNINMKR